MAAKELNLKTAQIERLEEEQYDSYIANLNQQAQAIYYAKLSDVLEDQRLSDMEAQAAQQNAVYESRAQSGRHSKAQRAAQVRASGGRDVRCDGMLVDTDGSLYCDSDLSDFGVFS